MIRGREGIFASGRNGDGGDIEIRAKSLLVEEGAVIQSSTFGTGSAGNLTFDVDTFELRTGGFVNSSVGLAGTGNAGSVTIRANESVQIVGKGELGISCRCS